MHLLIFFLVFFQSLADLTSFYQNSGTTFTIASINPTTAVVSSLANFSLSKEPVDAPFEESWGSACFPAKRQMFLGPGFMQLYSPPGSGTQELITISHDSGAIINRVNLTSLWPKQKRWFDSMHFDTTRNKLWVGIQTNTWNSNLPQLYVVSEIDPQNGDLRDVNSFRQKDFPGSNLLLDQATTYNEATQEFIGVSIHNNETVSLWKLSTESPTPVSFLPVLYKNVPFKGRLWGMKWIKQFGYVANTEHIAPGTSAIVAIDPESGVLTPIVSNIKGFNLNNWDPGFDPKTSQLFIYAGGTMWHKFLMVFDLKKQTYTTTQLHGSAYSDDYFKGFCP